jgi:hypothetical protein
MFSATVLIVTKMTEPGVKFLPFDYNCDHTYVTKCELASNDGNEIRATITLTGVPTAHGVEDTAVLVHKQAMRRLEFHYGMSSGESQVQVRDLKSHTNPDDDIMIIRGVVAKASVGKVSVIVSRPPDELREILERRSFLADVYFEMFYQAKTSSNVVVEFLGYYQIISYILGDDAQADIEKFILAHDLTTPQTQKPHRRPGVMETVYTRLRNEIAHARLVPGTMQPKDISKTKAEIAERVSGLQQLTIIAINNSLMANSLQSFR